jgi:hypothetical protein
VVAGQTFTLTTGADVKTLGSSDDTINATHLTLTSGDIVDAGEGDDTIIFNSTGTAAFSTATGAKVSGVETVKITNINGSEVGAIAAAKETVVATFSDVAQTKTVIIGGIKITADTGGATAEEIAKAIATGESSGKALVGAGTELTGYTAVADGNVVTFTATTSGNKVDLADTGTAKTATAKSVAYAITEGAGTIAQGDAVIVTINGQSFTHVVQEADATATATTLAAELEVAIDSYLGADVSDAATGTLTIEGDYNVFFTPAGATDWTYAATATAAVASSGPSLVITDGVTAVAGTYAGDTVSASNFVGATSYVNELSESKVTFSSVPATAEVTIQGNAAVSTGDTVAAFASTATAPVVNITGGTSGGAVSVTASKASSITINSDGAPLTSTGKIGTNTIGALTTTGLATSTLTINADSNLSTGSAGSTISSQKIVVAGDATSVKLGTITNDAGNLTSIDASGLTAGGATLALNTTISEFLGGAGGDTITSAQLTDDEAVIDAGDGIDVLIATNAHIDTVAEAAAYKNFEALVNLGPNYNGNLISGIQSVGLVGAGTTSTVTNLTPAMAANISYSGVSATGTASDPTTATLSLANSAGDADVLSIKLGGSIGGTSWNAGKITTKLVADGFETINLTAAPSSAKTGASAKSDIKAFDADKVEAINLSGTSFILQNIATTKPVTIDGSALTGDRAALAKNIVGFTTAGSAKVGSTIIGSDFNDTFTIGAEGSTYQGGAGTDEFSLAASVLLPDGTTDTVIDGGAGDKDKITITGGSTLTDVHFTNVSNVEALNLDGTAAVSVTGLAAGAKSAFADGMTVTSGTLANNAKYTFGAGLYDKDVTLTLVSSGVGNDADDNIAITTGAGDDTVSVTAKDFVAADGAANGQITVATGAGDDVISVETKVFLKAEKAPVIITAGAGADKITSVGTEDAAATDVLSTTYVIAAGDSPVDGYDSITGFDISVNAASQSQTLKFDDKVLTSYAATAASGETSASLTVTVSATGVVTFGGSKATAGLSLEEKIDAVASVVVTNDHDTALFTDGDNTYIFNNDEAGDSLVELVGVTGLALVTTNTSSADGSIFLG